MSGHNQESRVSPATTFASVAQAEESKVPEIIAGFVLQIRAIKECATAHIKFAQDSYGTWAKDFIGKLKKSPKQAGDSGESFIVGSDIIDELFGHAIQHSEILSRSLLIFGFSVFDAFIGMLLRRLYHEEPSLIYKVEEKTVKVSDLINCKDLDEAVGRIIDRDISTLLRQSYEELFGVLAARHGLNTLTKFATWPNFIEAAQRRNLITHCNGVVNSQYLDACKSAGYQVSEGVVAGERLTVDEGYLRSALDILHEVGTKLGHTLWRKSSPARIEESEKVLTNELFVLLVREEWELAKKLGEFAISMPHPQRDLQVRISRINYAQALKWSGDNAGAVRILDAVDWSGSIRDLRLGVEVIRENYDTAADLMRDIGKKGELIAESGYHEWPVFREFRKSEQFKAAFKDVYGTEFALAEQVTQPSVMLTLTETTGESQMPSERPEDPIGK